MTQLAEAYFHIKRIELSSVQVQNFGNKVSALAASTAIDLFPPDTIIDVRLEEGSLKGWILVIGTLIVPVYGHVADYKSFKESVTEIVNDAKSFGDSISNKVLFQKDLEGSVIYRKERRTKTPGRIKRIIQKREWLDAHQSQLSRADREHLSYEIERLVQMVLADIPPSDRKGLRKALGEERPHLPPAEAPRLALSPMQMEQVGLFDLGYSTEGEVGADYHQRFLLSEGPLMQHSQQKARPTRTLLMESKKPEE